MDRGVGAGLDMAQGRLPAAPHPTHQPAEVDGVVYVVVLAAQQPVAAAADSPDFG